MNSLKSPVLVVDSDYRLLQSFSGGDIFKSVRLTIGKMAKKLALILLFIIFFRLALPLSAFAYDPTGIGGQYLLPGGNLNPLNAPSAAAGYIVNPIFTKINFENAVFKTNEMNLESFVWSVLHSIGQSIITMFLGCWTCMVPVGKSSSNSNFGIVPAIAGLIDSFYASKPVSGIAYLADLGTRLNIVKPALAQGLGYQSMTPFMPLWAIFRNITYVFFTIIIVFIGFSIMFRMKISPQAVITIQSALPRIVFGLILITFSYAIVGFLVDIMWVLCSLIVGVFNNLPGFKSLPLKIPPLIDSGGKAIITIFAVGLPANIIGAMVTFIILGSITILGSFTPFAPLFLAASIFIFIFLALVFIIAFIRVLWTLAKAYIGVVLGLIFGPFQILIGVLPGSNAISQWFRTLLANMLVLPTVVLMVYLAGYIIFVAMAAGGGFLVGLLNALTGGNLAQYLANNNLAAAILQSNPADVFLLMLISWGILLLTPKAADIIHAFMEGKPFGYGSAIGESISGGTAGRLVGGAVIAGGSEEAYQEALTSGIINPTAHPVRHTIAGVLKYGIQKIV